MDDDEFLVSFCFDSREVEAIKLVTRTETEF